MERMDYWLSNDHQKAKGISRICVKTIGGFAIFAILSVSSALAQQRYEFQASEYVSTDDNRAPQSAFSYDMDKNCFTINARGANNIAFKMSSDVSNKYFICPDQQYYVIEGTNLSTSATSSYVWWFNGVNRGSQEPANAYYTTASGRTLVVWNIAQNSLMSSGMDFTESSILISAHGQSFINAQGLTSTSSSSTIHRVDYLEKYGIATLYPELQSRLGYTEKSLTTEIRRKLETTIQEAQQKLQTGKSKSLQAAVDEALAVVASLSATSYAEAYKALHPLQNALLSSVLNEAVESADVFPGGLHVKQSSLHTYVLFYADHVVRILKSRSILADIDKLSMSVIRSFDGSQNVTADLTDDEIITVTNGNITIQVNREDGHISAFRADGSSLIREQSYGTSFKERSHVNEYDRFTIRSTFALDKDEYIFGMGQIQDDKLNRRGCTLDLEQWNMRVCIPYFQSSKNYGLFWDNYSPSTFSDNYVDTYFESTGSEIDYYILAGDDSQGVMTAMRWLTGDARMMPLWNFGLYQSKERYKSASETMGIIQKYRELHVPIDCVVQDWQYWGNNSQWNALEFLNSSFSNYQQMINSVHNNHAHLLISVWANFGSNTKPFAELEKLGRLIHVTSYPSDATVYPYDVWSDRARDIYWKYMYNGLVSKGVDAYWMDSTEPDYARKSDSEMDYLSDCGRTWRIMRNSFVLGHVSGVYQHHREQQATDAQLAQKRVSILTRSGFAGQQRYAAQTWSGDISASWETLRKQIPAALGFTTCGIPYWNNDNGAFFVGYQWGDNGPFSDPKYRSLYLRWTQFSTFTGMLRFHGSGHNCEIWQMGQQGDASGDFDQVLKYIKMRYSLLPYIYSTSWQITHHQRSLMTALPLAFNADRQCYDQKYEYMFGDAFLVCPVVNEGQTITHNYLPAGQQWIDFWTGEQLEGGQTVTKQASIDVIPLYVKAGSIVPWGPEVEWSNQKPWDSLELRVYPGQDGDFTLYEDEFDNYNYEQGAYTEIPMHWDDARRTLTIGAREGKGFDGMLRERQFNIVLVNGLRGIGDAHATSFSATIRYVGEEVSVVLPEEFQAEVKEDCTNEYIQNPSFEADGRALTALMPKGWKGNINTSWYGVNVGGGNDNPAATDGTYLFGVWDGSTNKQARIHQSITLPAGDYRLTVDMQASNRTTADRVGKQRLFAGDNVAYFRDQVLSAGQGDLIPLQTVSLSFSVPAGGETLSIGVDTSDAPHETWYKIDNFRLYRILQQAAILDPTDAISLPRVSLPSSSATYDLNGRLISKGEKQPGMIVIKGGKKLYSAH